jgi:hypothetical protein
MSTGYYINDLVAFHRKKFEWWSGDYILEKAYLRKLCLAGGIVPK